LNDGSRPDVFIDEYGTLVTCLSGGLNSPRGGNWGHYLNDLARIIYDLHREYRIDAWVIKMENDVLDDLFYVDLGLMYDVDWD